MRCWETSSLPHNKVSQPLRKLFKIPSLWTHPLTTPLDKTTDSLISLVPVKANLTTWSLRFCQRWAVLYGCGFVEQKNLKALIATEQINKIKKKCISSYLMRKNIHLHAFCLYVGRAYSASFFWSFDACLCICQGTEQKSWWKWPLLATDFLFWFWLLWKPFAKPKQTALV